MGEAGSVTTSATRNANQRTMIGAISHLISRQRMLAQLGTMGGVGLLCVVALALNIRQHADLKIETGEKNS